MQRESSYSHGGSTSRGSPTAAPLPPPPPPPPAASKEPIARSASCKAAPGSSSSAPYAAAPSTRAAYYPSTAVPDPSDHVWAHHFNMLNSAAGTSATGGGVSSSYDPSRATTSSRDEASVSLSNVSDLEAAEWIEEDEPGVCLTIRELGDGTRELRRIRFRYGTDRPIVRSWTRESITTLSIAHLMHAPCFCGVCIAAGRGSARTGPRCGGSRTERGYKRSTCSERWDRERDANCRL